MHVQRTPLRRGVCLGGLYAKNPADRFARSYLRTTLEVELSFQPTLFFGRAEFHVATNLPWAFDQASGMGCPMTALISTNNADKAELSSGSCHKTKEATHRTPGKEAIHELSG
jgi:hypothetical protein